MMVTQQQLIVLATNLEVLKAQIETWDPSRERDLIITKLDEARLWASELASKHNTDEYRYG